MSQPYKKNKGVNNRQSTLCKFFQRGSCANQRCPYLHVRKNVSGHNGSSNRKGDDSTEGVGRSSNILATVMKLFFEKQQSVIYKPENRMLDLSNLASYDDLKSVVSSIDFNVMNFCDALCQSIRDTFVPPPAILCVDKNDIKSIFPLASKLEETGLHTSLMAFSAADNKISAQNYAECFKNFKNLVEINMKGNPTTTREDYKSVTKKYLPFLLGLDGQSIEVLPLRLPWPQFYDPSAAPGVEGRKFYDSMQRNILEFIQVSILNPLEAEPQPGAATRVNALYDVYAPNATLTLNFSSVDVAFSAPRCTVGGHNPASQRSAIRDIVSVRVHQKDGNHNLLHGVRSTQVAIGRLGVCTHLERWLYPPQFAVTHYIHTSPDVAVVDNNGCGPNAIVQMKEPISVVTLHGVMMWRHVDANSGSKPAAATLANALVIKRNFTRVLTIIHSEPGRWLVANDTVLLTAFTGTLQEGAPELPSSMEEALFRDVHPYDVVFTPADDPNRALRFARKFRVPQSVVATLSQMVTSDLELVTILKDLGGVPLETFEQCAQRVQMDPLASIFLCRLGNRFQIEPTAGVGLLQQYGNNWLEIERALTVQH